MLLNLPGNETRLRIRIKSLIVAYALACRVRCPESLALALRVVFDDRARDIKDGLRRAIVLLQTNHFRVRIMLLEVEYVRDVRAPPLVN